MSFLPEGAAAYFVPYCLFLTLVEIAARLPFTAPVVFPLRVLGIAGLLAWYWRRGAYPELRGYRVGAATLADIAMGLAIAGLWVAPYLLLPSLSRGAPFDPAQLGEQRRALALGLRLFGFGLVTPLVEELFVRSFLVRFTDVFERGDFRSAPIAQLSWRSFVVSALWFTFTHQRWQYWVALPAGIALNAWLVRRRQLMACVIAHAVANASIWAWVVFSPTPLWEFL